MEIQTTHYPWCWAEVRQDDYCDPCEKFVSDPMLGDDADAMADILESAGFDREARA